MNLLFCSDPLDPRALDMDYEAEAMAADRLGVSRSLVDFEALSRGGDAGRAVRRVPHLDEKSLGVFRGWMMTSTEYSAFHAALLACNIRLINSPAEYEHCHYLPRWYHRLQGKTPASVWTDANESTDVSYLMDKLRYFGDGPVIVKDWVKSRKHEWVDACYIPSAADSHAVERVVGRFLELQGDDLNVGLVFRKFVEFEQVGTHSKSGMPLTREYRLFYVRGNPIQVSHYWGEGDYGGELPPLDYFNELARSIDSQFFTMDVAKSKDGDWQVMELGDGQVAALPDAASVDQFHAALASAAAGFTM